MPIQKFKTFKEAEEALWNNNPDKKYFERISELWNFAHKLSPIKYPRGIFKFKDIHKANRHRDKIEIDSAI